MSGAPSPFPASPWLPLGGAALLIAAFHAVGALWFDGYQLDLGSVRGPTPRYKQFLAVWGAFGAATAVLLATALSRWAASARAAAWVERTARVSDRTLVVAGTLGALAIPLALRVWLLGGAPLTDDESAYRFMAELLASGRLYAESPPLKLFFDRVFMINDGRFYAQYFIGWPALLAPGVWLRIPGATNAVYSALTVPPLFLALRHVAGRSGAALGLVLYLTCPMLAVGAATELAHTSCLMALVWTTWFALRSRDPGAPRGMPALLAAAFSVAFFIRPASAVGIALPLLAWWAVPRRDEARRAWLARALAFAAPTLAMAALFLAVNKIQNDAYFTVAYQRFAAYMVENGFRFAGWEQMYGVTGVTLGPGQQATTPLANLGVAFDQPPLALLTNVGIALFRLNFDLFGWPSSLLFLCLAGWRRRAWLFWLCGGAFFLTHLFFFDSGIDSFGPVHYFETAWPILVLTVLGVRHARATARGTPGAHLPGALVVALVVTAWCGYAPVRFRALAAIAAAINQPRDAVARAGLQNAVVFAPRPFVPLCASWPNEAFVVFRPNNDPDLQNSVLWVNHIDVESDRRLMALFPARTGYVMQWTRDCTVRLRPLAELRPGEVPDGFIGGTGKGLE
jgi:hypothetical protein